MVFISVSKNKSKGKKAQEMLEERLSNGEKCERGPGRCIRTETLKTIFRGHKIFKDYSYSLQ